MSRMSLDYALVDVFAESALEGNMLAIFTDARGLTTDQMQALARETNLAETTFVLPEDAETEDREGRARADLYDSGRAAVRRAPHARHCILAAPQPPCVDGRGGRDAKAERRAHHSAIPRGKRPRRLRYDATERSVFGATHKVAEIADVLGLAAEDLDAASPAQTVSTGMAFCVVPLASLKALGRLEIPQSAAQRWLDAHDAKFFYCIARNGQNSFRARMQFYNGEDPATGSGAGCAVAWMVQHGWLASDIAGIIEQGSEILRPSRITVKATQNGVRISDVFVGGRTIPVARGQFFL